MFKIKMTIYCLLFISSLACTKKKMGCTDSLSITYNSEAEVDDGSCEYGGLGGNNSIRIYYKNQGIPVISKMDYPDSAFIRFNAIDKPRGPGPGAFQGGYDRFYVVPIGDSCINISGLKKGKYFIYLTAIVSSIIGSSRFTRQVPIEISNNQGMTIMPVNLWSTCCFF
jgi:hypothetical protein